MATPFADLATSPYTFAAFVAASADPLHAAQAAWGFVADREWSSRAAQDEAYDLVLGAFRADQLATLEVAYTKLTADTLRALALLGEALAKSDDALCFLPCVAYMRRQMNTISWIVTSQRTFDIASIDSYLDGFDAVDKAAWALVAKHAPERLEHRTWWEER